MPVSPSPRFRSAVAIIARRHKAKLSSVALAAALVTTFAGVWLLSEVLLDAPTASGSAPPASDLGASPAGNDEQRQTAATEGFEPHGRGTPHVDDAPVPPARRSGNSPFTTTSLAGSLDHDRQPARLIITDLAVDAPVEPVGLDDAGRMEIPSSGSTVGWYARGALPGDEGVAILTSHVDTAAEGPGVLFTLRSIEPGALFTIVDNAGSRSTWVVESTSQQHKDDLPRELLFDAQGPPRLAVITCAGRFDRSTRSYEDNLIVWARPA